MLHGFELRIHFTACGAANEACEAKSGQRGISHVLACSVVL